MRKYRVKLWIPNKGIIVHICNANTATSAIVNAEASYAFAGMVLGVEMLFQELEINKCKLMLNRNK